MPTPMIAVSLALFFQDYTLLRRQQEHVVFQTFSVPLCESRLRMLVALTSPPPATFVSLKMSAVHGPGDEEGNWIIIHR